MENFSIKSYSAQLRIYSGSSDPPKAKLSETSSNPASESSKDSSGMQSRDGDSFSLSLEARIVQISMKRSDDGAKISNERMDGASGSGMVKTLMQALGGFLGNDGVNAINESKPLDVKALQGRSGRGYPSYHPMGNPEDVASQVLQHLQAEHAEKGGALQAFIDVIQKRMEHRKETSASRSDGSSEFRLQVDTMITSSLTEWARTGGGDINIET
jgi:hypothetical protein